MIQPLSDEEKRRRILLDFCNDYDLTVNQIRQIMPEATDRQIAEWTQRQELENLDLALRIRLGPAVAAYGTQPVPGEPVGHRRHRENPGPGAETPAVADPNGWWMPAWPDSAASTS